MLKRDKQIAYCQEYTRLWQQFFTFFADGFENKKITPEAEGQFFQIMTELARKQYRLRYLLEDFCPADESFLSILGDAVSLSNLHEIPESQFQKIQLNWHIVFIELNKCLGRLIRQRELEFAKMYPKGKPAEKNAAAPGKPSAPAASPTNPPTQGTK